MREMISTRQHAALARCCSTDALRAIHVPLLVTDDAAVRWAVGTDGHVLLAVRDAGMRAYAAPYALAHAMRALIQRDAASGRTMAVEQIRAWCVEDPPTHGRRVLGRVDGVIFDRALIVRALLAAEPNETVLVAVSPEPQPPHFLLFVAERWRAVVASTDQSGAGDMGRDLMEVKR